MLARFCRLYLYVRSALLQPGASSDGAFPDLQEVLSTFPTEEEIVAVKLVLPALYEVLLATDYLQADKEPTLGQVFPWLGRLRLRLASSDTDPAIVREVKAALWADIERRFQANTERATVAVNGSEISWLQP